MMRKILLFSFSCMIGCWSWAAPIKAVKGKVAVDGAAVYVRPDFDSEVIDYLNQDQKIPVSTKQFLGVGGMGLFHKIRTPRGKLGYLPDTDVILPKGTHIETPKGALPRVFHKKGEKPGQQVQKDEELTRKSIYLTRYIGGSLSMIDYTEKFSGDKLHSQTPFFGLRMTGPDILFKGPPLDFNLMVTPLMPKYLSTLGSASGFLVMSDLGMNMPLYNTPNSLLYYGLGILLNWSQYKASVGAGSYDSTDVRLGIDLSVGYAYRFSRYAIRGDVKYFIEKTLYFGEMLSFQAEY